MKRLVRVLVLFLLIGMFILLGGYLALAAYYSSHFPVNTWINGVYCTGKTVDQVNQELVQRAPAPVITLVDAGGMQWQIDGEAAGVKPDYTKALQDYLQQNSTGFWIGNLREAVSISMEAGRFTWPAEGLRECFETLPLVQAHKDREEGVSIQSTANGYVLQDGNAMRLNVEKAYAYLEACLKEGEVSVDLGAGECYSTLPDTDQDKIQRRLWMELEAFQSQRIIYDMGAESIELTPEVTSGFLETAKGIPTLDEGGRLVVSEGSVRAWVEELAARYDTCDTTKEFQSTRGDVVSVKYGTYGTKLDVEAEVNFLMGTLTGDLEKWPVQESQEEGNGTEPGQGNPEEENGTEPGQEDQDPGESGESGQGQDVLVRVPVYLQQGFVRGLDDIGGTYIEVDMTQQHMYYYMDGELVLDTDIVTGDTSKRHGTPQGINFVYNKQRNRILRGPDYASPVKYWMPVRGAVGIHDANWRSRFGGQIYKTNGSHGCINTPSKIMGELYDMVEIGTPVIMFY